MMDLFSLSNAIQNLYSLFTITHNQHFFVLQHNLFSLVFGYYPKKHPNRYKKRLFSMAGCWLMMTVLTLCQVQFATSYLKQK